MKKEAKTPAKQRSSKKTRLFALLMAVVMLVSVITAPPLAKRAEAATALSNPRIVSDFIMKAGQKVTWDCIYFGSYPQAEVITTEMSKNYTAIKKEYLEDGDLIVSDSLYQKLSNATDWDINGDITINGEKYRRINRDDATCVISDSSVWYNWSPSITYHYFKYEPIKWRVLKVEGNKAFLLADKALDDMPYNKYNEDITWEKSTIRSWLNGYGASANPYGIDFRGNNFIDAAFTEAEQKAIHTTAVKNADNIAYGIEGGNDTKDKVFLLSITEVYTSAANSYGFISPGGTCDEARTSKSSTYAKAKGLGWSWEYACNCWWWLRSPGCRANYAVWVGAGEVKLDGTPVDYQNMGSRPALNLNLSSSNLWRYAGTVCSDGTVKEPVLVTGISLKNNNVSLSVGDTCQLQTTVAPENATNKGVTYQSSNTKVATVNAKGLVKAVSVGTTVITATASDGGFQAKATIKVTKQKQTIKVSKTKYTKTYGNKAFKLGAKTTGNGRLTYKSSNTKVVKVSSTGKVTIRGTGKATITIKAAATSKYKAASKKISITVKPKRAVMKKLTSPRKGTLKVTWEKTSKVSGYEITVATNEKFTKGKKTYKVKSYKTTSKTISGLKSGRTYYVRIRGYKTVKGSKKPVYGRYSEVKKIKIK
ncbi:MAG: Ig-like domain-containing protein [Coprococcus sp.]|nr:Ig-like domain-containing protein [Coprococcus sp.]